MCHGQYEYSYRELGPNMNIHITWLTYVRTGPKKKKIAAGPTLLILNLVVITVHERSDIVASFPGPAQLLPY